QDPRADDRRPESRRARNGVDATADRYAGVGPSQRASVVLSSLSILPLNIMAANGRSPSTRTSLGSTFIAPLTLKPKVLKAKLSVLPTHCSDRSLTWSL